MTASKTRSKPIAEVDFDAASYIGNGEDGVYIQAAQGKDGWYVSTVVDVNSGANFCDALVTDDGPYLTEVAAITAGCYGAADWCIENNVRYRRQLARALRAAKAGAR